VANKLRGKVAVISGSTAGIGFACAQIFVEEGAKVVLNDHGGDDAAARKAVDTIRSVGGEAIYVKGDIAEPGTPQLLIDAAVNEWGRLDILMNNAISGTGRDELSEEGRWDLMFASLKSAFVASRLAVPIMIGNGGGVILNTSSIHGLLAGHGGTSYASSKAALIQLTRQMAVQYGKSGIRVNAICPGRIVTEAKVQFLEGNADELRRQKVVYPLGRPGTLREAATAALFLVSDDSSFVTGHALAVDGGLTAQLQDGMAKPIEEALRAEWDEEDAGK